MVEQPRFDIFFEWHIGFGVRWRSGAYPLELSIAIPFITVVIGVGSRR